MGAKQLKPLLPSVTLNTNLLPGLLWPVCEDVHKQRITRSSVKRHLELIGQVLQETSFCCCRVASRFRSKGTKSKNLYMEEHALIRNVDVWTFHLSDWTSVISQQKIPHAHLWFIQYFRGFLLSLFDAGSGERAGNEREGGRERETTCNKGLRPD